MNKVTIFFILLLSLQMGISANPPIKVDINIGFSDHHKIVADHITPVRMTLTNIGSIHEELDITIHAKNIYKKRVSLPAPAKKQITFYVILNRESKISVSIAGYQVNTYATVQQKLVKCELPLVLNAHGKSFFFNAPGLRCRPASYVKIF